MIDAAGLRVMKAIADEGSFTAAATSLGYTQPAISQMVRRLEQRTGTVLVERVGRNVRLTEAILAMEWSDYEPHFKALQSVELTAANVGEWLSDWSALADRLDEQFTRRFLLPLRTPRCWRFPRPTMPWPPLHPARHRRSRNPR